MRSKQKYFYTFGAVFVVILSILMPRTAISVPLPQNISIPDSASSADTSKIQLLFPFNDNTGNPYLDNQNQSPLFMQDPPNIKKEVIYNPATNSYEFESTVGDFNYRTPTTLDFNEFQEYESENEVKDYWYERSQTSGTAEGSRLIPKIYVGGEAFETIFGSNTIDIRPQGSAEVSFGILYNKRDDPSIDVRQQKTANFDFDMRIQMNVVAKIGDKIEFKANYNTESSFDFENTLKLKYEGKEDEIIKLIEAGNVSLPLRSTLIRGSQSLFGVKTELQFGKTRVTALFSQQQSETQNLTVQGGAQTNKFQLTALDYEQNKHFFFAHLFRDFYEPALESLPVISSDVTIQRVEVWVTNIGAATEENRNIVAFTDLGEGKREWIYNGFVNPTTGIPNPPPSNNANDLILRMDTTQLRDINTVTQYLNADPLNVGTSNYMIAGEDYVKLENARKLKESEYTYNSRLGFISLNTSLNPDQVLAVSVQYTVIGDDRVFQVGEFSDQGVIAPSNLIVKLLKSNTLNTKMPMWDLMMKNVYAIGAYQVQKQDFRFNILYSGNQEGVPTGYFTQGPEDVTGVPLIHLLGLDNLDYQMNPIPGGDGIFDYIDGAARNGGTFQGSNGRLFFTALEPFGSYIRDSVFPNNPEWADQYAFDSLYTETKAAAEQYPDRNKYILEGMYKSQSGSDISLNALNVPQGSVTVTAGGVPLAENLDYTVDYTLGRVKIINEGILNSGVPINVSLESNSMFNVQQKRMMGMHVDHEINKNFHIGGTVLNLHERPLTPKINYGDDPVSNTMWGLDLSYSKDSRWLTKIINKLPGISTNQVSKVTVDGEFAQFIPGHSNAIGATGTSYIDDFEGAKSTIDLKNISSWFLATTPQLQPGLFPEGIPNASSNPLASGMNRAKLAWYIIDPLFYDRSGTYRPPNVDQNEVSKNSSRQVLETEVFPNKDIPNGQPLNIPVFNLAFYPQEVGPYNYNAEPMFNPPAAGIDEDGFLKEPDTRWGGIMRRIESSDFEAANIEYIEFWVMDPFSEEGYENASGELYINLGEISEDILNDGRKSYENGLPSSQVVENVDTTAWGRVPQLQALVESFSNAAGSRPYQDVGYDGLSTDDEQSFYSLNYLRVIEDQYTQNSNAYQKAINDPSSDNYHYFRGSDYDQEAIYSSVTERYKYFNNPEGNSPTDADNPESYPTSATNVPNIEDINRDNTLSESERYFQYKIEFSPEKMVVGQNYITDIQVATNVRLANGDVEPEVKWYQFKVPVKNPEKIVGSISDFRSIRFMRMFMKEWNQPIVLRFATFELVRGEWRAYNNSLLAQGEYVPTDDGSETNFVVSTVNIEENGNREPIPYVVPPGITREVTYGTTSYVVQNEQSLSFIATDLLDGDARGVFKTTDFDFRQFKNLQMYVHAESQFAINSAEGEDPYEYGDMTVFIRIGSDFTRNYYEYEIPVEFTPWGTSFNQPDIIWPEVNNMDINLEDLVQVKQNRNVAMRNPNSDLALYKPYIEYLGDAKVTVLGSPNTADVMGILIGVRNPKKNGANDFDSGNPISAEVWVDELRLTDFNDKPGWAATGRMEATLADLGRIGVSASHSSAGFGALESKITQIPLEYVTEFIFTTDIDWGKFLGEKAGVRIPMHYDYNSSTITPEYNPLDPDVKLKDELDTYQNKANRDSVRDLVIDQTHRQNLNFMNVRKERTNNQKKPKVYDIENFDVSFSYQKNDHKSIDLEVDNSKLYRGGLGYNWNGRPKNYKPLQKVKAFRSKHLALIKDFNFYALPKVFSFRTDMNRTIREQQYRDKSFGDIIIYPTYERLWNWNRNYDLKYDFSKSLNIEFKAGANAYINEAQIYPDRNTPEWEEYKNEIWREIGKFGTMQRYNQNFRVNYNLPMRKIPILDWTTIALSYTGIYSWAASPISVQERMGNIIENSNQKQLNGSADLNKLYNKVPYFKKINVSKSRSSRPTSRTRQPQQEEEDLSDTTDTKPKVNYAKIIGEGALRILLSVKKASITWSKGMGTVLPGYTPTPSFLGMDWAQSNAPGWGFVFGSQADIREQAVEGNWITEDPILNNPYMKKLNESLSYKVNTDILNALRIDFDGDRVYAEAFSAYFRYDTGLQQFMEYTPVFVGNFSISYSIISTSFAPKNDLGESETFNQFLDDRQTVAYRLANENPAWLNAGSPTFVDTTSGNTYPIGYGPTSQEVLYFSFLGAYSGRGADNVEIASPFPSIPLPNWRITFAGLTNIDFIAKAFRTFNVTSGYRSMLSLSSWRTNVNYTTDSIQLYQSTNNLVQQYDVGVVSLIEAFNPLIGLDMTMHNSLSIRFEYKKTRNLAVSFVNNQMTEVDGSEVVVGLGYRIKNLNFSVGSFDGSGKSKSYRSDLNMKLDFGIRDNITTLRRIDENNSQISAGSMQYTLNFSADYMLSQSLQIRAYYNWTSNNPYVSSQFPNSTTSAGFSLRFNLAQ